MQRKQKQNKGKQQQIFHGALIENKFLNNIQTYTNTQYNSR